MFTALSTNYCTGVVCAAWLHMHFHAHHHARVYADTVRRRKGRFSGYKVDYSSLLFGSFGTVGPLHQFPEYAFCCCIRFSVCEVRVFVFATARGCCCATTCLDSVTVSLSSFFSMSSHYWAPHCAVRRFTSLGSAPRMAASLVLGFVGGFVGTVASVRPCMERVMQLPASSQLKKDLTMRSPPPLSLCSPLVFSLCNATDG